MVSEVAEHTDWWPALWFPPINLWSIWNRENKMKIEYIKKDITTVNKGLVVHGCNCSGGFGTGVAGAIKRVWPPVAQMFRDNKNPKLGDLDIMDLGYGLYVGNGYTQQNYGYDGKVYADIKAIKKVIFRAMNFCTLEDIDTLYIPKIGSKRGGLSWEKDILPAILSIDKQELVTVIVCEL